MSAPPPAGPDMAAPERPSLSAPELQQLWDTVRERLEHHGVERRGRISVKGLPARGRFLAGALVGRTLRASISLEEIEAALRRLGVGETLADALAALGHPVSPEPVARRTTERARRDARASAREAARAEALGWPEPWAAGWFDGLSRAGVLADLDTAAAVALVRSARAVLDRLDRPDDEDSSRNGQRAPASRIDLAAEVLGSSHALDAGTRLEAAVSRALQHRFPGTNLHELWERAGAPAGRVSAPVLTWNLVAAPGCGLSALLASARAAVVPIHLSQMALRRHPLAVGARTDVLVVENPRLVEAAAQAESPLSVVALNGNPSSTAILLVEQLLACGASLRYHGDFDAAGLRICARMAALGLRPWKMDAASYLDAVALAERDGAVLPVDAQHAPATPWDPPLEEAFDRVRRVVHEERLIAQILGVPERP